MSEYVILRNSSFHKRATMYVDSTAERQPLSKAEEEEETFAIPTTIQDFGLKMEPFGFDDGVWDVQPSLGSLQPPNSLAYMTEDFPCCYDLNGEESGFGDDAVDTDVCGRYPSYQLPNQERAEDKLQMLSQCICCKMEQVQILTVPCKHLTMCESCASDAIICPLCNEVIEATIRVFIGFSVRKRDIR